MSVKGTKTTCKLLGIKVFDVCFWYQNLKSDVSTFYSCLGLDSNLGHHAIKEYLTRKLCVYSILRRGRQNYTIYCCCCRYFFKRMRLSFAHCNLVKKQNLYYSL